ncbi:MAG: radical SAM protein, partial [Deltaproteobacteria bacterium]
IHCHATGGDNVSDELSTDEGKRLIDQIAQMDEFRTLVFSGGEPLVRKDIFTLLRHSQRAGLANIIATNGLLIDEEMAFKLKDHGVVCNAISLDAAESSVHNFIRDNENAYSLALRAIEATKKAGILLQLNTTAMEYNFDHLPALIDYVQKSDSGIMLMYQLVAVGKGEKIKSATLKKEANKKLCELIAAKQKNVATIIEPVAGPQYWPAMLKSKGIDSGWKLKLSEKLFHGCCAGRSFLYVKSNGEVWACPFLEVSGGNVRDKQLKDIYHYSDVFRNLQNRKHTLKGACGDCEYNIVCGGCRGRAFAHSNDYLSDDPCCFIKEI